MPRLAPRYRLAGGFRLLLASDATSADASIGAVLPGVSPEAAATSTARVLPRSVSRAVLAINQTQPAFHCFLVSGLKVVAQDEGLSSRMSPSRAATSAPSAAGLEMCSASLHAPPTVACPL